MCFLDGLWFFRFMASLLNSGHFPPWWKQTVSSFPRRLLEWRKCFLDGWRLSEGGSVDFSFWTHQGSLRKATACLLPLPWNTLAINKPYVEQSEFIEKPRPTHWLPLRNGTFGYELPRWQIFENDWTNFTWLGIPACKGMPLWHTYSLVFIVMFILFIEI